MSLNLTRFAQQDLISISKRERRREGGRKGGREKEGREKEVGKWGKNIEKREAEKETGEE